MRKFLASLLAVLTLIVSITVQANATEATMTSVEKAPSKILKPKHMKKVEVKEYELYKNLKKKSKQELLNDGWSTQKIEEFEKYNYVETLKEKSKLSNDELKSMGYSDEKITILKSTDTWSENQLMALSSEVMIQGGVSGTQNNNAIWNFYYEWAWDTNPGFPGYDVLGARWMGTCNGSNATPALTSSLFYVNMIDLDGGYQEIFSSVENMTKVDLNAGEIDFRGYYVMGDHRTFAMSGYGTFTLNHSRPMERVTMSVKYGHTTSNFVVDPSISIFGTDIGFGFTKGTYEYAHNLATFNPDGTEV